MSPERELSGGEFKKILRLAIPLTIGQLSAMLLGIIDTIMVGALGVRELAALSFANALFSFPFVGGIGLITSISILASGAHGRNEAASGREICRQGLLLALLGGTILFLLTWAAFPLLKYLGQPAGLVILATPYLWLILLSIIPALAAMSLKIFADALDRPWPAFWIFFGGVLINIPLNQLFIHGFGPLPAYGLNGAGLATLLARLLTFAGMLLWLKNSRQLKAWLPERFRDLRPTPVLKKLTRLGLPASFHLLAEVGAFSMAGLCIGLFGPVPLAAHQIALTCAGTAFMIPLGISMALTVRMGKDGHDPARARRIAHTGWLTILAVTSLTCLLFILFPRAISAAFVDAPAVTQLAAQLLIIVGIFQLVDGLQIASAHMLRGLHDVSQPAWIAFLCYWPIGIPTGLFLAHQMDLGARGIWWGLASGLGIAALILSLRLHRLIRNAASA
ncbi:MAG: MATE family efflux transporter [Verrucomicrobiales bacterium]